MSFSPLCGPCNYDPEDSLIHGKLVSDIGMKYGVSGSQVSLRFIVQQALDGKMGGVIPKSNDVAHILSNRDVFSFNLDDDDMMRLAAASKPSPEAGDCDVP
jgi:diketogulonate reductase-like aldo/keto reductase